MGQIDDEPSARKAMLERKPNEILLFDEVPNTNYRYGYGRFTPECMQKLHNPRYLVACLAIGGLCLGMVVNGLVPISISTLERRFDLTSTQTGVFAAMYKTASLLATIPVAHYGTKGHKGRYLGLASLSLGVGCIICTLPQFISGPYEYGKTSGDALCANSTDDHGPSANNMYPQMSQIYFALLLIGQIFHGFGGAPMSILAVTFIDDNVSQMASPLYTGIYMGARNIIGPALGYVGGGLFLKIYGDVGKVDPSSVQLTGASDSRWYGAWWIGFLLAGLMAVTIAFPVLGFAKQLPVATKHRRKDVDQATAGSKVSGISFGENLKDLPQGIWCLLRNPTIGCLIVQQIAEAFLLAIFITFTPKLVETLFNYSSSDASMLSGAILLSGGFLGIMFGGYLIRKFTLRCRGIMVLAIACHSFCLPFYFIFLLRCQSSPFAGVTLPYQQNQTLTNVNLMNVCNQFCDCSSFYNPVCDSSSGVTYYSPCFASCEAKVTVGEQNMWANCSCTEGGNDVVLSEGICSTFCPQIPAFICLYTILALATFTASIPTQQALLRSVQFEQRTLAMGLMIIADGIGVFMGSVSFGRTIDLACILWKTDKNYADRSCLRYTRSQLAFSIIGFAFGAKLLVILLIVLALKFYRSRKSSDGGKEEQQNLST